MRRSPFFAVLALALASACAGEPASGPGPSRDTTVSVAADRVVHEIDDRYVSFAVDLAQVVGATFWNPSGEVEQGAGETRVPPYDFARPRLRTLARELAPAYVRIGGSPACR